MQGKVALVTDQHQAAWARARTFASEGAAICVADIHEEHGSSVSARKSKRRRGAVYTPLDVVKLEQWEAAVAQRSRSSAELTILCNNTGANFRVSFDDQTEEMWHIIMETTLTGAFLGIKAAVPAMRRAGGSSIINIGSLLPPPRRHESRLYRQQARHPGADTRRRHHLRRRQHPLQPRRARPCGHALCSGPATFSPNDWSTSIDNPENLNRRVDATPMGRLRPAHRDRLCLPLPRLRRSLNGHRGQYRGGRRGGPLGDIAARPPPHRHRAYHDIRHGEIGAPASAPRRRHRRYKRIRCSQTGAAARHTRGKIETRVHAGSVRKEGPSGRSARCGRRWYSSTAPPSARPSGRAATAAHPRQ